MVKNFANKSCFAICGRKVNGGHLFTYKRNGIKVHHAYDDSLNVNIVVGTSPVNVK